MFLQSPQSSPNNYGLLDVEVVPGASPALIALRSENGRGFVVAHLQPGGDARFHGALFACLIDTRLNNV